MKTEHRKNYFLLALAIIYCIIALIQIFVDGILTTKLYLSIALISLTTTSCEFFKSGAKWIRKLKYQIGENDISTRNNAKRHIDILGQYPIFSELTEYWQKIYDNIGKNTVTSSEKRWNKVLNLFESAIQFVEVFLILFFVLIIPLLKFPDNLPTTKIIDILSLLSVAFAFWSIYVNESTADAIERSRARISDSIWVSNYYLDIIKVISEVQSMGKMSTVEREKGEEKDVCH